ncbi:hypothetical protein HDV63DRAFT_405399 [Trichoderma sp. SZMC 28014]
MVQLLTLVSLFISAVAAQASELDNNFPEFKVENLNQDARILNTLAEVRAMNAEFEGNIRTEKVDGKYIQIFHNTTTHVATLAGEALEFLETRLVERELSVKRTDGGGSGSLCSHRTCVIITSCSEYCTFCYPVICV